MRALLCLLPLVALLSAATCGPTNPDIDDPVDGPDASGPCTPAMCGAVPSVPPRMCQDADGIWTIEEVTGCERNDAGVCAWAVNRCTSSTGDNPPLSCTQPNSCPDGSSCISGFCYARETCNDGQDMCAQGSLCCLQTNACVPANQYNQCPLPPSALN